ncbi:GNAT family N-acetyltransferase [Rhodococcus sp. NPDC057529]|uniref:GNAT family N-acetyltransferase n=1 Tax=Rhodococcus sp. NPDC057529 TaxID=3346158 RepID=UPI00366DB3E6
MEANLASHAGHLHFQVPNARVLDGADVYLADSGLHDDTFNIICRARFSDRDVDARVAAVVGEVRALQRPFSWWVAPTSAPDDLPIVLRAHGLVEAETEEAMVATLTEVPPAPHRGDLVVVAVESAEQLRDYASLVARNWDPPSAAVVDFFAHTAPAILAPTCASRFVVGYRSGEPVAGAEIHVHAGVAGLYGIVTLEEHRRQGLATAVTLAALELVRAEGVTHAVLQASTDGAPVYERIGFTSVGTYTEFAL